MKKFINKNAYLNYCKILVFMFFLNSCQKSDNDKPKQQDVKLTNDIEIIDEFVKINVDAEVDEFFSIVSKVEVFSYLDRNKWLPEDRENFLNDNLKEIKNIYIRNHIKLNKDQIKKMQQSIKHGYESPAEGCFNPRHLVMFYNKNNKIIGNIEICFDCNNIQSSESTKKFAENTLSLTQLFKEFGITYFKDTKEEMEEYYKTINTKN